MTRRASQTLLDETQDLRRCVRELAALSVLSAVWIRSEPREIAQGLSAVVSRSLPLKLVYARVNGLSGSTPIEVAVSTPGPVSESELQEISKHLGPVLETSHSGDGMVIPDPLGSGTLRLAIIPIGCEGDCGVLVAGSQKTDFPSHTDRLFLSVAANQAAIVLQQKRSEEEVWRREQELTDFFENASVALHWVGADGTILRANRAELDLLGFEPDEYIGRHIAEFHVSADAIADILRRLKAGESLQGYEAQIRCKDGTIRDVLIDSSVRWENGEFIHTRCFTRDITDRKRAEAALRERETWLAGQSEALEAALHGAPLEASLRVIVRTATSLLGEDVRIAFYLADPEGSALHHVVGMPPGYAEAFDVFPIGERSMSCGLAVYTGQPIFTSDVRKEPSWKEWLWLAEKFDFRACWSIPIHTSERKFTGAFAIYWPEPREATERDLEFITQVSRAAAIIISQYKEVEDRGRAQAAERKQAERLKLLWEAAAVLLKADNADTMLRGLLGKIGSHLGVDTYFNFLVTENGDGLRLASYEGIPEETARTITRLDFGQAVCGTVALHRQPIVATHIQQSDDPKVQLVKSFGLRSYACNPLIAGDRLFGTLSFASRTRDDFDPDEIAFIETISHYATMAYERLRLLNELREADRRKDEFLATLAHELRNPLAPVRNAVQVMRFLGSGQPDLCWSRDVIERQVDHLSRLIDDLLDISRITRNKLELRRERIELTEVIKGAVEGSRPLIEQYGHQLTVSLPPRPVHLDGDVVRLAQVFLNLLNNAAKYTERGGHIWLSADVLGSEVVVSVRDTGVGIPAETLPRLFQMFYQVDHSLEKARGGLGIGLSLVRRLVDLHGGKVEARSDGVGKGSEFIVRLPLLSEQRATERSRLGLSNNGGSKPVSVHRILVVDDNRDSADSLAILLRLAGNEVHAAYDGVEGVEAAERFRPDVILLDIGMPRLNGYDACRRIRKESWGRDMIVIALTGWGQDEDRRRTLESGFDAHMVKPIDSARLMSLLASTSSARRGSSPTSDQEGDNPGQNASDSPTSG